MVNESPAISATKVWVEQVIVKLNFCPFAKKEVLNQSIRYCDIAQPSTQVELTSVLHQEIIYLNENRQTETTLIIVSKGLESFFDYLDVLDKFEDWIDDNQYRGIYQIASFHPDYCFEDEHYDAPSNYTNRSPYPVFHLLREDSLEKAIASYKHPELIPQNNINKANDMGSSALKELLKRCFQSPQC
ncbi:DUF1415 domain-containing protein [Aliiglaciecola litoralis]|uniref:DUF1415 domain-containing protein n=1 Tax=Aliiglaciecola litoralis TaxID=582857 RepID=A0ABN1LHF2_9ALTE